MQRAEQLEGAAHNRPGAFQRLGMQPWAGDVQPARSVGRLDPVDVRHVDRGERRLARPDLQLRLTGAGRDALAAWMDEPARFPRIQNEAVVRLLAADLVGEEAVLESLEALRDEIDAISAQLDAAEAAAAAIPSRTEYLLLNHQLSRRVLQAHTEWLDEVERKLSSRPGRRASGAHHRRSAR